MLIEAKQVSLSLGGHKILDNLSFCIPKGRSSLFVGESGSGKSSLLRCLLQLCPSYEGEILFEGKNLAYFSPKERSLAMGFVSQKFGLFPHMNVLDNCLHPQMQVLGLKKTQAQTKALSFLTELAIANLSERFPHQLSGGQQQRVAIARALCMNSELLLLDEPSSALDPTSSAQLSGLLHSLLRKGVTLIIATHDMKLAESLLDSVYLLKNGSIIESFDLRTESLSPQSALAAFIRGQS